MWWFVALFCVIWAVCLYPWIEAAFHVYRELRRRKAEQDWQAYKERQQQEATS